MEWLSRIKNKLQFFLFGLMAGLILGGGFFILKLDDYFKELRMYKNIVLNQHKNEKETKVTVNKKSEKEKHLKYPTKKSFSAKLVEEDTGRVKKAAEPAIMKFELDSNSVVNNLLNDTLIKSISANESVVLLKDELIATKVLDVINFNTSSDNLEEKKDSLLQKVSGVKSDISRPSYKIEIWKSPLNYKGYKMTKNKIVLFGLVNHESLKLYQINNNFYIKTSVNIYKIGYSTEFKVFEKINDESILAKLK